MPGERSMRDVLHNLLQYGDLSFRDFVELVLYHPEFGYYARPENPVGKAGDYVTAPTLSPVFSFAIGKLVREFMSRSEGEVCSIVDIGCGDGGLIEALAGDEVARFPGIPVSRQEAEGDAVARSRGEAKEAEHRETAKPRNRETAYFGVDRNLRRVTGQPGNRATFVNTLDEVPGNGPHLFLSNELFDALPFARLVQRGEHLHELWVAERDGTFDWTEHEAPPQYEEYFAARGISLADGQFADVSLEWDAYYADVARFAERALIVTIDYGFEQRKLFHPRIRRFGTAAAYSAQRVSRDLLADPGEQDLTAHINFTDLERAGEREGASTLFFDSLAKFLLALGITEHELFRPVHELEAASAEEGMSLLEARDEARRLVLPDGIGEDLRVLVQAKGLPVEGWSFQRILF
ncbi:MAG TPA: SAM-dependent methyltransferase [Thermoanaerobaculia bacterium]|nr:SAM-dependent methyltransferase [Thermoanaerobaculia bacterium]